MYDSFIPKIDLPMGISNTKIDTNGPQPFRLSALKTDRTAFQNFSEVMTDMVKCLNDETKRPDKVMTEALINPNIDIHDVMLAINQSELTLTVATQATTKFIQGYEKIISMQV